MDERTDEAKPSEVKVGKQVDCNQADDRKVINLVKKRRLLYARTNLPVASYYAQVKKLWFEVASEMGWSVAEVRRKWSHIRNSYSRHLRNETYSTRTSKGRVVSRWYLADELEFLREHMATDLRPTPYSELSPTLVPDISKMEATDFKPYLHSPWFQISQNQENGHDNSNFTNDDSSNSFNADENTSYFKFFRGIYSDYEELPAHKRRLFRRQCLNFLHDLLDEETPASTVTRKQNHESSDLNMDNGPDESESEDRPLNLSDNSFIIKVEKKDDN